MAQTFNEAAAERRIAAYIGFLMASYDTDARGLADIAGIPRGTLTKFINAKFDDKHVSVLFSLARLTGIKVSFLLADEQNAEGVA